MLESELNAARTKLAEVDGPASKAREALLAAWSDTFAAIALSPLMPEQLCWSAMQATGFFEPQLVQATAEFHQRRRSEDAETTQEQPKDSMKPPGWIKLTRRGNLFIGYYSTDGLVWQEVSRDDLGMNREVAIGLAASSWNSNEVYTARFENVELTKP